MEDSSDPVVKAAVRPLTGDAELKSCARHLLESLRETEAEQTEEAIARWDAIDGKQRRRSWKTLFYSGVTAVSLLMLGHAVLDLRDYQVVLPLFRADSIEPGQLLDVSRYNAHEKLLLSLDDGTTTDW